MNLAGVRGKKLFERDENRKKKGEASEFFFTPKLLDTFGYKSIGKENWIPGSTQNDRKQEHWIASQAREWQKQEWQMSIFRYTLPMLITVFPLARSLHPRGYTYEVGEVWQDQIVIGGVVEIPIGKYVERGIVAHHGGEVLPHIEVRPIVSVISVTPLLSLSELSMVGFLAQKYLLPIHRVLAFFLPSPLLSRLDKKNYLLEVPKKDTLREKNRKPKREIHHYLETRFSEEKKKIYEESDTSTVWCFPDDLFVLAFFGEGKNRDQEHSIILAESTSAKKTWHWIDAYEKKSQILVWTRKILYYNLSAYDRLIYVEDAFGTEQYQYPYKIQNLDILEALSKSSNIDITIISSSPTLSLFANFREYQIITKR